MSRDLNKEAERAAPGVSDAEIAGIMGWRGPGAYTEATLRKIKRILEEDRARRTAPVSAPMGQELPPLPRPVAIGWKGGSFTELSYGYTERQFRQGQLDAIAPYAERIRQLERELAERKTASIDSDPTFSEVLARFLDEAEASNIAGYDMARYQKARDALIAYIDGRTAGTAPDEVRDSTWRKLLEAVVREFPHNMGRGNNGNAPGHCHSRPGIWDDDNGALAGKPCAWCIAWNGAADAIAAAPTPLNSGQEEAK
jgi:hypothetical protein